MSDGAPLDMPDAQTVRAVAASWLLRRRDYDVWSEEDQRSFDAWLNESLAHRLGYLRLEAVWQDANRLKVLQRKSVPRLVSTARSIAPKAVRAAFLLVVLAGIGVAASNFYSHSSESVYTTAVGERKVVTIADGSKIELNTDTTLRLSLSSDARQATLLKGEAFFNIAHNSKQPFVVGAGSYRVVDIGTEFAVRRSAHNLRVELIEGSARFESIDGGQRSAVLKPGDSVVATADSLSLSRKPANVLADALAWRRGVLVFHRTPLSEVIAEFNRYNSQKMAVADPAVGSRTITATLPTNDVAAFTRIATDFFGLHVVQHENDILITR